MQRIALQTQLLLFLDKRYNCISQMPQQNWWDTGIFTGVSAPALDLPGIHCAVAVHNTEPTSRFSPGSPGGELGPCVCRGGLCRARPATAAPGPDGDSIPLIGCGALLCAQHRAPLQPQLSLYLAWIRCGTRGSEIFLLFSGRMQPVLLVFSWIVSEIATGEQVRLIKCGIACLECSYPNWLAGQY